MGVQGLGLSNTSITNVMAGCLDPKAQTLSIFETNNTAAGIMAMLDTENPNSTHLRGQFLLESLTLNPIFFEEPL